MLYPRSHCGRRWAGRALLGLIFTICCLASPNIAPAQDSPVTYRHIVRRSPNFSIHVVTINLADPRVTIRVVGGGPVPDDKAPWVTTLLPPTEIANREHFDIAINGDFFSAIATKDIEGRNTGFVRGKLAAPEGFAMTDGHLWHQTHQARPYLEITADHTAKFVDGRLMKPIDPTATEIVGGGQIIVLHGQAVNFGGAFATNRHPRTVVGLDRTGTKLTLFIVDGRQANLSIGMTLADLSHEMIALGCDSALNLDGGGSTDLVWRDPNTHQLEIVNSPSDSKERSVADVLGVTVEGPLPMAK
jgi:exopolysaccharide biosynthesis protein